MPIARTRALVTQVNALSLSRMRYFGALSQNNNLVIGRVSHSAVELLRSSQPTTTTAVRGQEQEMRRAAQRQSSGRQRDRLVEYPRRDFKGVFQVCDGRSRSHAEWTGNRPLGDINAQFLQFAINLGHSRQRVIKNSFLE